MRYYGDIYRPPSEARSLIIQITYGCAHNACTFCDMYKDKPFALRPLEAVFEDIEQFSQKDVVSRIFLADGNALCLKTDHLLRILDKIANNFRNLDRVALYATAKDVKKKSLEDLLKLKNQGLKQIYIGIESGSDKVLKMVNKNCTADDIIEAGQKLKAAGIKHSAIIILGLGGVAHSAEHAIASAQVLNEINPEYLALMTLMVRPNTVLSKQVESGSFKLLTPLQILEEAHLILENTELSGTLFRANHNSNYVQLRGVLNDDKARLLSEIEQLKQQLSNESLANRYRSY